jgi:hypothetical protein
MSVGIGSNFRWDNKIAEIEITKVILKQLLVDGIYQYKSPRDKRSHCRRSQKKLHAAEEHSCYSVYGQVFQSESLYQEQPMLWADLFSIHPIIK